MSNIPSNEQIRTALDNAYAYAKTVQGGKNASYIPCLLYTSPSPRDS